MTVHKLKKKLGKESETFAVRLPKDLKERFIEYLDKKYRFQSVVNISDCFRRHVERVLALEGVRLPSSSLSDSTTDPSKPIQCLRRLRIFHSNRQIACETNCKLNHPNEYRACREIRSEQTKEL